MVLGYETSKLLVMQAAWMKDEGLRNTRETSLAKWHATESAFKAAHLAIQVFGSYGYSAEYGIERYFRNARAPIIYEGTTQIHKMMQAEHALGLPAAERPHRRDVAARLVGAAARRRHRRRWSFRSRSRNCSAGATSRTSRRSCPTGRPTPCRSGSASRTGGSRSSPATGRRKARNLERDGRVALSVTDDRNPYRSAWIRGRIVERFTGDRANAIVDRISMRYTGQPFPMRDRLVLLIEPERCGTMTLPFDHDRGALRCANICSLRSGWRRSCTRISTRSTPRSSSATTRGCAAAR